MTFDWQDLAALGVVAMAVAYLARLGLAAVSSRSNRGAGGCGSGCGSCPSGSSSTAGLNGKGEPLVMIGPPSSIPSKRIG